MKKGRRVLALGLFCALVLTLFAGCDSSHTHSYGKWKTEEEATCEEEGKKVRYCDCGKEQSKSIPQLEHEYESTVTKEAECGVAGVKTFKCSHCGDSYTEEIPQLEHEYENTSRQESTCLEDGASTDTCKICGDVKVETIPHAGHDFEDTIAKEASCQGSGEKTFACKTCEESYSEVIVYPSYSATEIYTMYEKSVGEVHTYDKNGNGIALGTCFVLSEDGQLITNYHVIEDAYSAEVVFGETTYTVEKVLAYDVNIDVAILKVDAVGMVPSTICKNTHQVGKPVYALGSSQGLTATMSDGMITYADREDSGVHYVQHDAPISSGNSGGPLINEYGEVIGINTMTLLDSQNINFAIAMTELDNLDYTMPMTMAELYEKESNSYKKLINLAAQNGTYSSENGNYTWVFDVDYSSDYTSTYYSYIMYYPSDDALLLGILVENASYMDVFQILIDSSVSGTYDWAYSDDNNEMEGTIYYYYEYGDSLSCWSYTMSYSDYSDYLSYVSSMASYLLSTVNYAKIGVTTADLGFIYFE